MKSNLILGALLIFAPNLSLAATVNAVADTQIVVGDVQTGDYESDNATNVAVQASFFEPAGTAFSSVNASAETLSFEVTSAARPSGSGTGAVVWGRARSEMVSQYRAIGSGTFHVNLALTGMFRVNTDRDVGLPLAHILGGFEVSSSLGTVAERVSNTDPSSPLFGLLAGDINQQITGSIAVSDGDMISLRLLGLADAGEYPLQDGEREVNPAFFASSTRLFGLAFVRADGFELEPITDQIAPVPLPAGLPLLLGGLAGLGALGLRNTRKTAQQEVEQ